MSRKMTADEKQIIQKGVEHIYKVFVDHVSEGRNMTFEAVDSIGQGRVWDGVNAMKIGLIDEFGGLTKAIEIAAETAKLKKYRIINLPEVKDPFMQLMEDFSTKISASIVGKELGEAYPYYKSVQHIIKNKGIVARMPFDIQF